MRSFILKYGLLQGLFLGFCFFIAAIIAGDPPDFQRQEIIGYASMILSLAAVFLGVKAYRDKVAGERLTFWKAFLLGLGIAAVAGFVIGLYVVIHRTAINPEFSEQLISSYRERIVESGDDQEIIARELKSLESQRDMFLNPYIQGLSLMATMLAGGLVVSAVSALILKGRPDTPANGARPAQERT